MITGKGAIVTGTTEETGMTCFALASGCFVGCVWWLLHRQYFVSLYWYFVPYAKAWGFEPAGFDGVFAALNLATVIGQSFSVGFVTALVAPFRPCLLAITAMALTFLCKIPGDIFFSLLFFDLFRHNPRPAAETWWITCLFIAIYGTGPLYGAFFAAMIRPGRATGERKRDDCLPELSGFFSRRAAAEWRLMPGSIVVGALLSGLWKIIFVVCLIGLGGRSFLNTIEFMVFAQGLTIGFCVSHLPVPRPWYHAIGAAVLMYALDVGLLGATSGLWLAPVRDIWKIAGLAVLCACSAVCGVYLADRDSVPDTT